MIKEDAGLTAPVILECSYRESTVLSRSQLEACWDDEVKKLYIE